MESTTVNLMGINYRDVNVEDLGTEEEQESRTIKKPVKAKSAARSEVEQSDTNNDVKVEDLGMEEELASRTINKLLKAKSPPRSEVEPSYTKNAKQQTSKE